MKKPMIHAKCGGAYEVQYSGANLPFLVCLQCDHKIEDWIKWSELYCEFWKDETKWKNKRDQVVCLLGYFANLYKTHYGVDFVFSLNERGLFNGTEAHHIRKLLGMFQQNALAARAYLDWLFASKVQQRKKRITSLGFLHTENLVNEFNLLQKKSQVRTRSTPLPEGMLRWLKQSTPDLLDNFELKDFGDLRTLLTHFLAGRIKGESIAVFVGKLKTSGIVDANCNIVNWEQKNA